MTDEEIMFERLFAPIKAKIQDKNRDITYLEKENAELNRDKTELVNSVTELTNKVAELEKQIENYKMSESESLEIIAELKKQNESLKDTLQAIATDTNEHITHNVAQNELDKWEK